MYYSSKSNVRPIEISQWLPIGLILLLGLTLRLYQLTTESLWVDEMLSIGDAETFEFGFPYLRPFYYLLLKGWMYFGTSDAWLRGLSVVFGLGGIFLTYRLGQRLIGESTGLIAALMMTLAPLFINHAQEIRMYTLISFLSLAGTLALSHVLEQPSYGALIVWVLARIALLLTNSNNVLILFPDTLLLCWTFRKQFRWLVISGFSMALIVLTFLPPLWLLTQGGASEDFMSKQIGAWQYVKPGASQILGMITQFTVYWPLRYLFESNNIVLTGDQLGDQSLLTEALKVLPLIAYGFFNLILLGLLTIPIVALFRRDLRSERLVWLVSWAVLPAIAMLAVSYTKGTIWFPRYLMFIGPYFLILLASGFVVVWHWRRKVGIAIAVFYLIAVAGGLKDYYTTLYRNDWQGVAEYIQTHEQAGDSLIYYSADRMRPQSLPRYYSGTLPINNLSRPGKQGLDPKFIRQELNQMPPVQSRLWLVCWVYCTDKAEMGQVFETVVGQDYQVVNLEDQPISQKGQPLKPTQTFKNLEIPHIQIFLVEPKP